MLFNRLDTREDDPYAVHGSYGPLVNYNAISIMLGQNNLDAFSSPFLNLKNTKRILSLGLRRSCEKLGNVARRLESAAEE
jgi:hypothetical protein